MTSFCDSYLEFLSARIASCNLRKCYQVIFLMSILNLVICIAPPDFSSLLAFVTPSSGHPLVSLGDPLPAWSQAAWYVAYPCNRILKQEN